MPEFASPHTYMLGVTPGLLFRMCCVRSLWYKGKAKRKWIKGNRKGNWELIPNKNIIRRKQDKPVHMLETAMRKEMQSSEQMGRQGAISGDAAMFIWECCALSLWRFGQNVAHHPSSRGYDIMPGGAWGMHMSSCTLPPYSINLQLCHLGLSVFFV